MGKFWIYGILAAVGWLGSVEKGSAQDSKLPHPFMWKSFNNPGYSGFEGLMNVNVGMRRAFWSKPLDFRSYFVSADYPFREQRSLGLGGISLFYQRDQEKSLMYVTNSLGLSLSTRIKVSRSTVLQFGIQPMLYLKSLDPNRVRLGDQYDPYYGLVLQVSPELIEFYTDHVTLFDMAAGIYGRTDFNTGFKGVSSLEYGFSVYHIIESTQSFLSEHGSVSSEENLLYRRYSGYLSYTHPFPIGYELQTTLSPYLMMDMQSVMKNIQFGVAWEEERIGMFGLGFRSDQYKGLSIGTLLLSLGVNIMRSSEQGWKLGYTFEVPAHQGTMYKNTSHSLSLHWYYKHTPQRCVARFDNRLPAGSGGRGARGKRTRTFRY